MFVDHPGKPGESAQDFELNLASIIDCFTVLITYLLVSASFISIGVFDVSIATNGEQSSSPSKSPPITLTVQMRPDHGLRIDVGGTVNKSIAVNPREGTWDYATLDAELAKLKTAYPAVETAVLTADNAIVYKEVVKAIEAVKNSVPSVYIGDQEVN